MSMDIFAQNNSNFANMLSLLVRMGAFTDLGVEMLKYI